jgi:hypothetical protein
MFLTLAVSLPAAADDAWYGIVKRKPDADYQQWLVGSKPVNLGAATAVSTDVGPLDIGACAQIIGADGRVDELSTRAMSHCDKTDYDAYFAQYRAIAEKAASKADASGM